MSTRRSGRRIRPTPGVIQMEATECGAASLAIILAHHGRFVPLERVREQCAVSRDGSSARNIAQAARANGMIVRAQRLEPEHVADATLPAIAHWGMNHFLVVEGIDARTAWLNDPAEGRRTVTRAVFDRAFTGILLQMEPGPEFQRDGARWSIRRALASRLAGVRDGVGFALLLSLGIVIPGLLVPVFGKVFVDDVLAAGFADWLRPLLLGMAACAVLTTVLTWLQRETLLRVETHMASAGSIAFVEHLLRLPIAYFGQRSRGEIAGRVALSDRVAQLGAGDLGQIMLGLVTASAYLLAMLAYAPPLAGIVAAMAAVDAGLLVWQSRRMEEDNRRLLIATSIAGGFAKQSLRTIEAYKAAGHEDLLRRRLVAQHARTVNLRQHIGMAQARLSAGSSYVALAAGALVLAVGGTMVVGGRITLGTLIAFQALMAGFLTPVGQLVALFGRTRDGEAYLRTLDDTLDAPEDGEFAVSPAATRRVVGALAVEQVDFRYGPATPPLLSGVSLSIGVGESVAIVGASGSGKSTLARVIAGLAEPGAGRVLVDGVPLRQVPRRLLRRSMAVVEQHGFLFGGTVRDNIALWDDSMPEERVVRAARLALIHDTILARPGGYASRLADGGSDLSGGQRQRLEIARALALDPRILILDEATAALDPRTEAQLFANLRTLGCTMIVIAHRYSAVRHCDRVIVLDGGRIVQQGRPTDLIAVPGPLRTLIAAA